MPPDRPLRADAQRNRAKVLEAAETVFEAQGTGASTEEIARTAGLGIGTVFRHFPTKESLLEAVFLQRIDRLATEAEAAVTAENAGRAFFAFFTRVVDEAATKNAIVDALTQAGVNVQVATSPAGDRLRTALATLLRRAQQVHAVRSDVRVAELYPLLIGASRAAEHAGWDREVKARTLEIVFDGLRWQGPR